MRMLKEISFNIRSEMSQKKEEMNNALKPLYYW
jgi:hypothetical protein